MSVCEAGAARPNKAAPNRAVTNQITQWKDDLLAGAASIFEKGNGGSQEAVVDLKVLHAKIGELTLENYFLEGALTKAGMLSVRT